MTYAIIWGNIISLEKNKSLINHSNHFETRTGFNDSLRRTDSKEQFANKSNISMAFNHILQSTKADILASILHY